ncbi:hypothetical protein ABID08_004808 [Rhizobium binae]|uniref:Uncharacterized protein n=1 Tax=Rhizobium binae TaxID=1138190 RepID=A0ABV2MPF5_9HYPH
MSRPGHGYPTLRQSRPAFLDNLEAGIDAVDRQGYRLFAENGLAGSRRRLDEIGVARRDEDRIDVLGLDEILRLGNLGARPRGKLFS